MSLVFRIVIALLCSTGLMLVESAPAAAQQVGEQDAGKSEADDSAPDTPSTSADELARKVVETTGDPTEVDELAFSFVVERGGEEVARRRHVWRPKEGRLKVSAGDESYELRNLHEHDLSTLAKDPEQHAKTWREVAPDAKPEQAAKAWSWFINDSYWLLVPAKLFDPGVNRSLDEEGRLVLTFGEVGLTPGDRYMLTVDEETGRVERWDFVLESGNEGSFTWTDYEQAGPLLLSKTRTSEDGDTTIRFEGVQAKP